MNLVSLQGVTKTYPGPLTVLRDVSLDIAAGEDVAVVGPSGSGKTTMLSIMGTLDTPTAGEVWVGGVNTSTLTDPARARLRAEDIGFVFQQFFLLPTLSALDNVAEGLLYRGWRRPRRRDQAMEALDRLGLTARAHHRPGELSGGEQQRVAIARAIAGGPRLVLADEPTGSLDQASGHMIVDYLQAIADDGTTVVVITHDQALAARFGRQISLLDGTVVEDDSGRRGRTGRGAAPAVSAPRETPGTVPPVSRVRSETPGTVPSVSRVVGNPTETGGTVPAVSRQTQTAPAVPAVPAGLAAFSAATAVRPPAVPTPRETPGTVPAVSRVVPRKIIVPVATPPTPNRWDEWDDEPAVIAPKPVYRAY